MKAGFERYFVQKLEQGLTDLPSLIHVLIGPRQVGKTTGVEQLRKRFNRNSTSFYASADGDISKPSSWLMEHWEIAKASKNPCLLVIDEIQKVENWSETIKKAWDEQTRTKVSKIKLILLGSSSLTIQKGLSESLAGRFRLYPVFHWSFEESQHAFQLGLEQFLKFGGYPGSYAFVRDQVEWLNYLKDSIINPVIGKDILTQVNVKSPALFKQCFDLACSYGAQEISYTKLLGQLQDRGNTDLVKHYLDLLEGAFLLKQLFKYSNKKVLTRSSSPKLLPYCPALYSVTLDADLNNEERGRAFEIMIGAQLIQLPGELYYWREKNFEVDFVYRFGKKTVAIEVKTGNKKTAEGLEKFKERFPTAETLLITPDNFQSALKGIARPPLTSRNEA